MKSKPSIDILDYKECLKLAKLSHQEFFEYRERMKELKSAASTDIKRWSGKPSSQDVCRRAINFVRAIDSGLSVCNQVIRELGLDEASMQKNATARLAQVLMTILETPKEDRNAAFKEAMLEELDSIIEVCES